MHRKRQEYLGGRGELVVVVDCSDLDRAGRFWTRALGYDDEGAESQRYRTLLPSDGVGVEVLLQRVDDVKVTKNRVHLDMRTRDLEAEVQRVVDLGAELLTTEPLSEHGWDWHVLADPDGNEFCVIQPPPDHWA
ncbi:VOC family protein [Nocardioides sp.]|uniref:VOC family protein n=1 Tax=Nocardioides sp. TaxID=35761 RepID=UPI001A1B897E|nr:VOC family protein [Nocardioides sp.]MBJ7356326.1 VOC family protein [Nocardioides sp.]